jgi:hypothetical protein
MSSCVTWLGSITVGGSSLATQQRRVDVLADRALQHRLHVAHHLGEVERHRVHRPTAAERQQLAHQLGAARRGLRELLEVAPLPVVGGRLEREVRVVEDYREQVVEVVCDAACELAHALEPAGLLKLRLELLLARPRHDGAEHVRHGLDEAHVRVAEVARAPVRHGHDAPGAVLPLDAGADGLAAQHGRPPGLQGVDPKAIGSSSRPPAAARVGAELQLATAGAELEHRHPIGAEDVRHDLRGELHQALPSAVADRLRGRGRRRRPAARPCAPARRPRRAAPRPAPRAAPR